MKPNLPRQLLWTEVRTMDEFINDDITNHGLYHIVNELPPELLPKGNNTVKLFNEMYYQMTRIYYEEPEFKDYYKYLKSIVNDMGWNGSADLVFIMIYTYIRLKDRQPKPAILGFANYIQAVFSSSAYWPFFLSFTSSILRYPPSKFDPKVPHPVPARDLDYDHMDFEYITIDFNLEPIQEIVKLWTDIEDKKNFARNFQKYINKYTNEYIPNKNEIIDWLDFVIDDENKKKVIELQKRIESLKAENEKLRCELNEGNVPEEAFNKKTGKPCFTSSQMGILIQAIANLTETIPPGKSTLGDIVEKIAGYSSTTLNQNMKGGHRPKDVDTVAEVFEKKLPNLAAEVKKL